MTAQPSIVLLVCEAHKITPEVFFGKSRDTKVAACRRDAIIALHQHGFSKKACARLIRRNLSTVQYWLNEGYREHRRRSMRARKSWARVAREARA